MVNKVILLGHVGKDPEIRHMDNNLVLARFSLATTERWNNKDGNRMEHTEWHNIVMWRNLAEIAEKYVRKGSLIHIEGKLRTRNYDDKDGVKRYVLEVVADAMQLVGPKPDANSGQSVPVQKPTITEQEIPETHVDTTPPDDLPF